MERRVILCAGHGGGDSGAVGQGTTEANEVIDIVNRCSDILIKDGRLQVVTVPHELSFEQSISWVNRNYSDINQGLSIEVHKNSAGVPAHGVETWYYGDDADSAGWAEKIQSKLAGVLPNRGIKPDTTNRWGQLGWVRNVNTWSILVEMGFVSNDGDPVGPEANQKYAKALAEGILNVWGLNLIRKGNTPMLDENYLRAYYLDLFEIEPTAEQKKQFIGRPALEVYNELRNSNAYKERMAAIVKARQRAKQADVLEDKLKQLEEQIVTKLDKALSILKADSSKVSTEENR